MDVNYTCAGMRALRVVLVALAVAASATCASAAAARPAAPPSPSPCQLRAVALKVNGRSGYVGVAATPPPLLSWEVALASPAHHRAAGAPPRAPCQNLTQTSYRVTAWVDTGLEGAGGAARGPAQRLLWDSGRVRSSDSLGVALGGAPLPSDADVAWSVQLWGGGGLPGAPSDNATFSAALAGDAWHGAQWIAREAGAPPTNSCYFYRDNPAPLLRKEFSTPAAATGVRVAKARLHVSGLGYAEPWLDGRRVGGAVLDPGWTDVRARVLYSSYDVTEAVREGGAHCLGLVVGNGYWNPVPLRFWGHVDLRASLPVGWAPQAIAVLRLTLSNGTVVSVATDTSWQAGASPVRFNNVYLGERYDARAEAAVDGWATAAFNGSWPRAVAADSAVGNFTLGPLEPQYVQPIRHMSSAAAVAPPARTTSPAFPGEAAFVADMGKNQAGVVTLTVPTTPADAGRVVRLRYGELLYGNGTLNGLTSVAGQVKRAGEGGPCAPDVAWQLDTLTLAGSGGLESFTPRFTWRGFRYVEITGWPPHAAPPTAGSVVAHEVYSSVAPTLRLSTASPLLDRIVAAAANSHTSNAVGVQTDCPHREKFPYGGDALASGETMLLLFDAAAFYRKRLLDYADAQLPSGGLTETSPFVGIHDAGLGGQSGPIGWDSFLPLFALQHYLAVSDARVLAQAHAAVARWVAFLEAAGDAVYAGLSDWMSLEASPAPLTGAVFLQQNWHAWSVINAVLGNASVAARYAAKATAAAADMNARFLNATTGVYAAPGGFNATQCGQSMPLYYSLVPAAASSRALDVLVDNIERTNGGHLAAGMFGIKTVLMALADAGRNDLAASMVLKTTYPSFGYMLEQVSHASRCAASLVSFPRVRAALTVAVAVACAGRHHAVGVVVLQQQHGEQAPPRPCMLPARSPRVPPAAAVGGAVLAQSRHVLLGGGVGGARAGGASHER